MKERWSCEQANAWYETMGWLRGCNFIGSDCANRLDMFQQYKSEEKLATAERELALCQKIGFNSVRIWANFDVYLAEPESYMEMFERYIALSAKYGQKVMVVLTHEEDLPLGETFVPKKMGEQAYALGYHQGRFPLTEEEKKLTRYHYYEYPELQETFLTFIRETVRKYRNDDRIFCWNVYNEPGITLGSKRSAPVLQKGFDVVRAEDPVQPLTADIWTGLKDGAIGTEVEQLAYDLSDIISFHSYSRYEKFVERVHHLRKLNRPLFLTEWLNRILHNDVAEIYPLLYLMNISNYCWGFVQGKTQTHEPWDVLWDQYRDGTGSHYDFTKWMHELFRPSLRPYDPHEIDLIEKFNRMAANEGR